MLSNPGNLVTSTVFAGDQPLAFYTPATNSYTYQYQNQVGTESARENNGSKTTFTSLPFGDMPLMPGGGQDTDAYHFAGLDLSETAGSFPATRYHHAQFRDYDSYPGQWLSPDPYDGSYDGGNPQSFNRYTYAFDNPLTFADPSGLDSYTIYNGCLYQNSSSGYSDDGGTYHSFVSSVLVGCIDNLNLGGLSFGSFGMAGSSGSGGGGSGVGVSISTNGIKRKICNAIPSGRTMGVSAGVGGIGSVGGGGELVINNNFGQVSAFGFAGIQLGWNGGASGSGYTGFVYGLNESNSNYSGGFTGANAGAGLGGFLESSSGGLTGGLNGLLPTSGIKAGGISFGGGLLGGFSGGATATNYSKPLQLGHDLIALSPFDSLMYLAKQVCK